MAKFYDAIIGLIVGDALGVPFEFKRRDTFKAVDMVGYGTHNQPAGTWSDDSSMTLATIESLIRCKEINLDDIMNNFFKWYYHGKFTPFGHAFDVGNTTKTAIKRYAWDGFSIEKCGGASITDNGNGSLMRILPLAFIEQNTDDIFKVSSITHAHSISNLACALYVSIAEMLLDGRDKKFAAKLVPCRYPEEFDRIRYIDDLSRDEIKSTGYVIDTLEAALWCLLRTDNYKDCVLTAVNLGNDTDTVAAVAGGLAGILYGVGGKKGIPEEWISKITGLDKVKELCELFECEFLNE